MYISIHLIIIFFVSSCSFEDVAINRFCLVTTFETNDEKSFTNKQNKLLPFIHNNRFKNQKINKKKRQSSSLQDKQFVTYSTSKSIFSFFYKCISFFVIETSSFDKFLYEQPTLHCSFIETKNDILSLNCRSYYKNIKNPKVPYTLPAQKCQNHIMVLLSFWG